MIDTKFDRKALSEVYAVLTMLDNEQYSKVPKKLRDAIKENKDDEYEVEISELENGKMLPDTINILSSIYTYYLASEKEKNIINKLVNIEKEKKYPIFKNKSFQKNHNLVESIIGSRKENFFIKILNKVKRMCGV